MPSLTLTDRFVAATPPPTRTVYFDTKARGLALRVTPAGTKTWTFVYRLKGAKPQWLQLGTYPAVPLARARALARDARQSVDVDGRDLAAERRTPPPPPPEPVRAFTFADLVPVFVLFQKGRKRTWEDDAAKIDKYLLPAWGARPLRSLTRGDVHELLDTLVARKMTVGVNRIQALISRLFTVALDRGLVDAHPAARLIKRFAETAGTRVLSDDELRALWTGLDGLPGPAADAMRLRLLLGQRGKETAGMTWDEIDLEAAEWHLPASRTKNKRPHVVALPPTALALLTRCHEARVDDEPRVFPSLTLQGDAHRALGVLHGGRYEWKDLRRTVATRLAELGFNETIIGRTLNHARYGVTGKHYNQHTYVDEIRRALTAWDEALHQVLDPTTARAPAAVLRHQPRGRQ